MYTVHEGSPINMLRQFSVHLKANVQEKFGTTSLNLNNELGKGIIRIYELFPGLAVWTFDLIFIDDYHYQVVFSDQRPYYFGYTLKGGQLQRFSTEDSYREVVQGQNFIIVSEPQKVSEFVLPGGKKFECCNLIVNPVLLAKSHTKSRRNLENSLNEIFEGIKSNCAYRYFGKIDALTGTYARIIIHNSRTDIIGQLLTEGAVMNMLASQIKAHDSDFKTEIFQPNLSKAELSRLTNFGDFIEKNVDKRINVDRISRHFAMSPKKLQAGIRFLYGCTVNEFISDLRMQIAKELMGTTDYTISEICYRIGYSSRSYFSKVFFEYFGMLPSSFKESMYNGNALFEIAYRSRMEPLFLEENIDEIVKTARKYNVTFDISGCLLYHRNMFYQIIEGSKKDVLQLFNNIRKDKRHKDIQLLNKGFKPKRQFPTWAMAFLSDKSQTKVPAECITAQIDMNMIVVNHASNSIAGTEVLWQKIKEALHKNVE